MTTLLTAILLTFFSLFFYVAFKFGIISSWSEIFYKLEDNKKGWIFSVVMMFLGIASGAIMFQLADGYWFRFIGLFAAFPICFVGAAPKFRLKEPTKGVSIKSLESNVHFNAAKISGVASIIWIVLMAIYVNPILVLSIPISAIICFAAYKAFGNRIWWVEMMAFWSVFGVFGYLIY